jgi:hypothetical protein
MLVELTEDDDQCHVDETADPYWTETLWLSFGVPERFLSGVIYNVVRPYQKISSLGVWLWDDKAHSETDILYFQNFPHQPSAKDFTDFELPCGMQHRVLEPAKRYLTTYDDGGELRLSLEFEALHGMVGRIFNDEINGSNQLGRVTGSMDLAGDHIEVASLEFRGRTWSHRPDSRMVLRPDETGNRMVHADSYAVSPQTMLMASSMGDLGRTSVLSGYLVKNGEVHSLVDGERVVVRNEKYGYPESIGFVASDDAGRTVRATGTCVNHLQMATAPGVPFPFWVGGTDWSVDGEPAWGQDHDVPIGRPAPRIS